jgi:hypothetical protein
MLAPTLQLGDTKVLRIGLGTNRLTNMPEQVAFVKEAVTAGVRASSGRKATSAPGKGGRASKGRCASSTTGDTRASPTLRRQGMPPVAIMRMARHTNFATTQKYLDLADVLFGDEVSREWYGQVGTNSGYKVASEPT